MAYSTSDQSQYAGRLAGASVGEALGESDVFLAFQEQLSRVAGIDRPVLIVGERGTGKELAARRLHYLSARWERPLVTLNCAALAPSLLEAELFGHEAGAFTGATRQRSGRFEAADGGTLFLDEIGLIPVVVQEKILRAVEYGGFERVGSSVATYVDTRIVAATNVDLPRLAEEGRFKQDLLDRLSFEVLYLPPLRHRAGDTMLLARHFASAMAVELDLARVPRFSTNAVKALESYNWPGNIRQIKNVVERAVFHSEGRPIERIDFDPFHAARMPEGATRQPTTPGRATPAALSPARPLREALRELEIRAVRDALEQAHYHQGKAAGLLGLTYDQFRRLYRKYKAECAAPE